tara:strand:- start:57 stop:1778 length:1722 start_codon:yes stop_codon:yes gene_type:complete
MIIHEISTSLKNLEKINTIKHYLDNIVIDKTTNNIDFYIFDENLNKLQNLNISYQVKVEDLTNFYSSRLQDKTTRNISKIDVYGSMGNYMTFQEIENKLDSLYKKFPFFISHKISIGKSFERRDIWALHVSSQSLKSVNKRQEILLTGLHHAREVITYTSLIYYVEWLCINYNKNKIAKHILDTKDLWIIPCLNPDGLVYNQKIAPNGGGLFRKNRRVTTNNSYLSGVDLNRNYGHKWGLNNVGSSSNPESNQYRGSRAFSEPETWALNLFVRTRNICSNINHHSYGNAILYPYGYDNKSSHLSASEQQCYNDLSEIITENLPNYEYGTGADLYYPVNGDATDWFYKQSINKKPILSWTTELGSNQDGFWPKKDRIIPICNEAVEINNKLCLISSAYYIMNYTREDDLINVEVKNKGMLPSDSKLVVKLQFDESYIDIISEKELSFFIPPGEKIEFQIHYRIISDLFIETSLQIHYSDETSLKNKETIKINSDYYNSVQPQLTKNDAYMLLDYQNNSSIEIVKSNGYTLEQTLRLYLDMDGTGYLEKILNKSNVDSSFTSGYLKNIIDLLLDN